MQNKANGYNIKKLKQAKIEIDKEKASIKEELKSLEAKRKSGTANEIYIKSKYKKLSIQYAIATTEATAVDLVINALEIEEAENRIKRLKKARKEIKGAITADEVAEIGLFNLFHDLDEHKKSYTEDLKKFAGKLINS